MPTYEKNKAYAEKYKAKLDVIRCNVPKESGLRDQIHQHAADMGESVNAFVLRAITEAMQRDKAK